MGALTTNRKRLDECFSVLSPSSFDSKNYCCYSNQIDTRVSKKPKISSVIGSPEKVNFLSQSSVSRLNRYPEPTQQFRREVHAPCRVLKFGGSSFVSGFRSRGSGFRSRVSESCEKEGIMGNAFGINILRSKYEEAKQRAFSALQYEKPEPKKEDVSFKEDSSDVEIIEDDNEVRSVVFDDNRGEQERGGLALLLETQKSDGKVLENGAIVASPSAALDFTKSELMRDYWSLEGPRYKTLLGYVDRRSDRIRGLKFDIDFEEARWNSMREERSSRKAKEIKEAQELKKPVEDSFHQPFLPLTADEEKEVQRAFSNSNKRKILVTHENSNIQITGDILQCLRPGAWLNDEVINIYLELLKERERRAPKKFLNCHFFNTFFYKKLIGGRNGYDYKSVRRWTTQRKLGYGLIECDKIFVPIHKEVHWCLAVINKKDKKFQYLDSLGGMDSRCLKVLAKYFTDEVKDKNGQDIDVTSWELEYVDDLPAQQNGFDCGVFMIKYADFYSRGMGLEFSQENMPYFRLRTAKEILRLKAD